MTKTAVILINVGTPNSPQTKDVRKYLKEFLGDGRVIDLPWLWRKLLVNGIIAPFRAPKSAKLYQKLFTSKGSPLLFHTIALKEKIEARIGSDYTIFVAMRYGNPSLKKVLQEVKNEGFDKIILLPLFPQYASSTTGTAIEFALKTIAGWTVIPEVKVINQFYAEEAFIQLFAKQIKRFNPQNYDHILFSYHGLPNSHIHAIHPKQNCQSCACITAMQPQSTFCYKATCYQTTRFLAKELNLTEGSYSTAFQSRLTKNWLTPFSDKTIAELAKSGKTRVLVVAPSFVTDCLETIIELGEEYNSIFVNNGGKTYNFVESLNDSNEWADVLTLIIKKNA